MSGIRGTDVVFSNVVLPVILQMKTQPRGVNWPAQDHNWELDFHSYLMKVGDCFSLVLGFSRMGDVEGGFLKTDIILQMRMNTHDCKASNFSKKISHIYSVSGTFQKHSVFLHWSFSTFFLTCHPHPNSP